MNIDIIKQCNERNYMPNKIILETNNISKKIKNKVIVENISLKIYQSDIVGFIGPNGAGKTTTIKLILGLQKPNGGTIIIDGHDLKTNFVAAISNVGAIIENPDHYMYLSGYDNLKITTTLYGLAEEKILHVASIVGLENNIHDKVKKYSLGMRQRLGIAQAIIHNPKLLILDEPMNGLDPEGIKELKQLLKKLTTEYNMAILISSHILSELENFCNRICIMSKGKIIKDSSISSIKEITDKTNYLIEVDNINLDNILYNYQLIDTNHIKINTTRTDLSNILKTLITNNINIYEIKKESTSLEDIFIKATKGNHND